MKLLSLNFVCLAGLGKISRHTNLLKEILILDTGLLDALLENGTLTDEQRVKVHSKRKNFYEQNEILLDIICRNDDEVVYRKFLSALRSQYHSHVANYIEFNGDQQGVPVKSDWPLSDEEKGRIHHNMNSLVEHISPADLVNYLYSTMAFNMRQKQNIDSKPTPYEQTDCLLSWLKRTSQQNFGRFIIGLEATGQHAVVGIIASGGALQKAHIVQSNKNVNETELVKKFNSYLDKFRSTNYGDENLFSEFRLFINSGIEVTDVKVTQSTTMYFWCKTRESLEEFWNITSSGRLKVIIDRLYHDITDQKINVKVSVNKSEYIEAQKYFNSFDSVERSDYKVVREGGKYTIQITRKQRRAQRQEIHQHTENLKIVKKVYRGSLASAASEEMHRSHESTTFKNSWSSDLSTPVKKNQKK